MNTKTNERPTDNSATTKSERDAFDRISKNGTYHETSDGNRIFYYHTNNGKPPMVFLHTLRTQAEFHHKLLAALAYDYDCILVDWPGHGRSSKNPNVAYTAQYMVDQVIELIEAKDLKEITLIGESIGGTGALSIAARIPNRIKAVYASNPYDQGFVIGKLAGKMVSWMGGRFSFVTKDEARPITKYLIGGGFYDRTQLDDRFIDLISSNATKDANFGAAFHSFLANQKTWHEIRKSDYARIPSHIPVTLHYGQQDWSSKRVRKENANKVGGNLKVVTSENTGHFSFLEHPERIIELIRTNSKN